VLIVYYKYTMNKEIWYDFPKLPSQKINSIFSGNVQYSVIGKENQPNIFIVKKSQKRGFVSKNVYIFSNINNVTSPNLTPKVASLRNSEEEFIDANPCTGELVIEHDAITNGGKKLYVCVPLITNHYEGTYGSPNVLDELIQDTKTMDEIEINSILPANSDCYYYETKGAIVLIFKTAIAVQSHFTGFSQGNIKDIQKPFLETSRYEIIPASKIGLVSNPIVSQCKTFNKSVSKLGSDYREGFKVDTNSNATTSWMECDNVDLDYSQEIPVYSVTSGSNMGDPTTIIKITLGVAWTLIALIIFIFGFPVLYFKSITISGTNLYQQIFLILCLLIGIILLIPTGMAFSAGQSNSEDLLISSVTFIGFFFISLLYLKFIIKNNIPYIESYNLSVEGVIPFTSFLGVNEIKNK